MATERGFLLVSYRLISNRYQAQRERKRTSVDVFFSSEYLVIHMYRLTDWTRPIINHIDRMKKKPRKETIEYSELSFLFTMYTHDYSNINKIIK